MYQNIIISYKVYYQSFQGIISVVEDVNIVTKDYYEDRVRIYLG